MTAKMQPFWWFLSPLRNLTSIIDEIWGAMYDEPSTMESVISEDWSS